MAIELTENDRNRLARAAFKEAFKCSISNSKKKTQLIAAYKQGADEFVEFLESDESDLDQDVVAQAAKNAGEDLSAFKTYLYEVAWEATGEVIAAAQV